MRETGTGQQVAKLHERLMMTMILSLSINLYMFRATMFPSSGETTEFMRHLVLVILCG